MQQLCCVLCVALLFRLAACTAPNEHPKPQAVKNLKGARGEKHSNEADEDPDPKKLMAARGEKRSNETSAAHMLHPEPKALHNLKGARGENRSNETSAAPLSHPEPKAAKNLKGSPGEKHSNGTSTAPMLHPGPKAVQNLRAAHGERRSNETSTAPMLRPESKAVKNLKGARSEKRRNETSTAPLHPETEAVKNRKRALGEKQSNETSTAPMLHPEPKAVKNLKVARGEKLLGLQQRNEISTVPLLQLMGLSLDSWGSAHVEGQQPVAHQPGAHGHMQRNPASHESVQTPRLPLLSLMSVSLDAWGCKSGNCSTDVDSPVDEIIAQAAKNVGNPLAQIYPATPDLFDPRGMQRHTMSFALEPITNHRFFNVVLVIFILLLLLTLICCFLCCEASPSVDDDPMSPSMDDVQEDFGACEYFDGSWAQVYREARGEQKEALELLFRCNIISTDEFAFSSVSPEHISECIWIATHMLRQKPLEEWVALWQQAQQTFEDSVTACFEARGGPPSNTSLPSSSSSTPVPTPVLPNVDRASASSASSRMNPPICEDDPQEPANVPHLAGAK